MSVGRALGKYSVRRVVGVATGAASCALVLSGCSLAGPPPLPYLYVRPSIPQASAASVQCPRDGVGLGASGADTGPAATPGTLPATFKAELVRYCQLEDSVKAVGGLRYPVTEETSPVGSKLLSSLTLPDQKFDPRDHAACGANYTPPVYLLLIDAKKHAYRPYLPASPCGEPRAEVKAAIEGLTPTKVTTYTFNKTD